MKFYPISSLVWQQPLFPSEPASSSIICLVMNDWRQRLETLLGSSLPLRPTIPSSLKQERKGWFQRLIRFAIARSGTFILDMVLTEIFVKQFPGIIGQFVHNNKSQINLIETLFAQVAIVVLNYVFSKLFVFKNKNKA